MQIERCVFLHRDVEAAERVLRRGSSKGCQRMLVVAGTKEQDKGIREQNKDKKEKEGERKTEEGRDGERERGI